MLLYQSIPPQNKSSIFKNKGWTESIAGYMVEAEKQISLIQHNITLGQRLNYYVTISHYDELEVSEIKQFWLKTSLALKRSGFVGYWVREVTAGNKIHYHIFSANSEDITTIAAMVERCLDRNFRCSKHIRPIRSVNHSLNYTFKNGNYYRKRLRLFVTGCGLKKVGTIGEFWLKTPKEQKLDRKKFAEEQDAKIPQLTPLERSAVLKLYDQIFGDIPLSDKDRKQLIDNYRWAAADGRP